MSAETFRTVERKLKKREKDVRLVGGNLPQKRAKRRKTASKLSLARISAVFPFQTGVAKVKGIIPLLGFKGE
jgi:hypothetical protein